MNDDFPTSKLGRDYVLWRLARIEEKLDLALGAATRLLSSLEIMAASSQFQPGGENSEQPEEVEQNA